MSDPNPPSPDDIGLPSLQDLVEIGRGGFATVYRAFQPRFNRAVAVKLMDPQGDALANERFERECGAMGALSSHPNIVTIFDAGLTDQGKPYLVMEFMPDGTLEDRLEREGPFPWQEVADLGVKLASALQMAHDAGVLPRRGVRAPVAAPTRARQRPGAGPTRGPSGRLPGPRGPPARAAATACRRRGRVGHRPGLRRLVAG